MAQEKKTSSLPVKTSVSKTDRLVMVQSPGTANSKTIGITVENFLSNSGVFYSNTTPASSTDYTGPAGVLIVANGSLYFSDTANHLKKVTGTDF